MVSSGAFISRFSQLEAHGPRQVARASALTALAAIASASGILDAAERAPRVQFLYLHHVLEDEVQAFRDLLRFLVRDHLLLSYSEAVDRIWRGAVERPCVALSFDDGMKSCLRAAEVMEEFGARACFFLCPSIVGVTDTEQLRRFCAERLHGPPFQFLSWDDVVDLRRRGHEIGNHTASHALLAPMHGAELEDEIATAKEALERHAGPVKHFSWPYGTFAHFSRQAREAVRRAGHATVASAVRGCHVGKVDPDDLCILRDHVVAAWPLPHIRYFMARSWHRARRRPAAWPEELRS